MLLCNFRFFGRTILIHSMNCCDDVPPMFHSSKLRVKSFMDFFLFAKVISTFPVLNLLHRTTYDNKCISGGWKFLQKLYVTEIDCVCREQKIIDTQYFTILKTLYWFARITNANFKISYSDDEARAMLLTLKCIKETICLENKVAIFSVLFSRHL